MAVLRPLPPDWLEKLRGGDRTTLARAITAVENDLEAARPILGAIYGLPGAALVVGLTGAPGVGKSTLLNGLLGEWRRRGKTIGVVAVDPSSPVSGGAILGDRVRVGDHGNDPGVFVRSLASRGHLGGLSAAAGRVVDVMDAAGREVVIVETVGAGQAEVEVAEVAHTKIVVCAPGLGDEIQAYKAGILEIADILVVNKGDNPMADVAAAHLEDAVSASPREGWKVPVLRTVATEGAGIAELVDTVLAHAALLPANPRENGARARVERLIASEAGRLLRRRLAMLSGAELDELCEGVQKGDLDLPSAAALAITRVGDDPHGTRGKRK